MTTQMQILSTNIITKQVFQATAIEGTPIIQISYIYEQQIKFNFYLLLDQPNVFKQLRLASTGRLPEYADTSYFQAIKLESRPKLAILKPVTTSEQFQQLCLEKANNYTWLISAVHLHRDMQNITYAEYSIRIISTNNIMIETTKFKTIQSPFQICKIQPLACTNDIQNKFFNSLLAITVGGTALIYNYDNGQLQLQQNIFQGTEFANAISFFDSFIVASSNDELSLISNMITLQNDQQMQTVINNLIQHITPFLAQIQQISNDDCMAMLHGSYFNLNQTYRPTTIMQQLFEVMHKKLPMPMTSMTISQDYLIIGCTNNQILLFKKQNLINFAYYQLFCMKNKDVLHDIKDQLEEQTQLQFDQLLDNFMGTEPITFNIQTNQIQKSIIKQNITRSQLNKNIIERTQAQEVSDTVASIEQQLQQEQISLLRNSSISDELSLKNTQEILQLGQELAGTSVKQTRFADEPIELTQQSNYVIETKVGQSLLQNKQEQINLDQLQISKQQSLFDSLPSYIEINNLERKVQLIQGNSENKLCQAIFNCINDYAISYYYSIVCEKCKVLDVTENTQKYIIQQKTSVELDVQAKYKDIENQLMFIYQVGMITNQIKQYISINGIKFRLQGLISTKTFNGFKYCNGFYVNQDEKYSFNELIQLLTNKACYMVYIQDVNKYTEKNNIQFVNTIGNIFKQLIQSNSSLEITQIQRCCKFLGVKNVSSNVNDLLSQLEAACIATQAKNKSIIESNIQSSQLLKSTVVPSTYKKSTLTDVLQISATCVFSCVILILFTMIIKDFQ